MTAGGRQGLLLLMLGALAAGGLGAPPARAVEGAPALRAAPPAPVPAPGGVRPSALAAASEPGAAAVVVADEARFAAAAAPAPRRLTSALERAWFTPAQGLEERVWRTRRVALERGVWSLDAAARSLLVRGAPLERAEAAVRLAPDLPAGRMAWAHSLWLNGDSPLSAVRAAATALAAFPRHLEASLWLGGSVLWVLALSLVAGGLLCIAVVGLLTAPHAAHDLGDRLSPTMPGFARGGILAALLLLPTAFGEGLLGLAPGLLAVGFVYGSRGQRGTLALAAIAVVAGAHPVARLAGAALEALPADPVAQAAFATSRGLALPVELARLEHADPDDVLAQRARARLARRAGNLGAADSLYQRLLAGAPEDPVLLNNAANVRLHLGHMEAAFDLYRRALEVDESPVVLFNLSQAYGRAFQVDDLTRTLELAQALDGRLVADLTRLQGTQPEGFVVDLPLSKALLWHRVLDPSRGGDFAAELRRPLAPGRLGEGPVSCAGAFAAALALGALLGARLDPSRWCNRCGCRVCPRCHPEPRRRELCTACHRLFYQPEETDRALRLARIEALREREARMDRLAWLASVTVPGAAGVLAGRPLRALVGAVSFALAASALWGRHGAVPDPLVAGAAGPFALVCLSAAAGFVYVVMVAASLAARKGA